jgi:hypothetical protein
MTSFFYLILVHYYSLIVVATIFSTVTSSYCGTEEEAGATPVTFTL